jgi:pimeloyl-ACP methyl ester carboxylesterase
MPTIDLPHGVVHYRLAGPERAGGPPVVFVHGFLVSATLWSKTADALAAAGVRSYAPDWPLGSHPLALRADADQSPRGIARQIASFLEALELDDVTLVGNDTGGAICQFLLDSDPSRIGRVVLTNCDAFTNFPPAPFGGLFKAFRSPPAIRLLLAPMRATAIRHSPAGFGLLVSRPLDAEQTRAWVEP